MSFLIPALVVAAGAGLLLMAGGEKGQVRRVNILGHEYRIYEGEGYMKIVREYDGQDVMSITAQGTGDNASYEVWTVPGMQPELLQRLKVESALDLRDRWQEMGLPPQTYFEIPGEGQVAGDPAFLFVREGE